MTIKYRIEQKIQIIPNIPKIVLTIENLNVIIIMKTAKKILINPDGFVFLSTDFFANICTIIIVP